MERKKLGNPRGLLGYTGSSTCSGPRVFAEEHEREEQDILWDRAVKVGNDFTFDLIAEASREKISGIPPGGEVEAGN